MRNDEIFKPNVKQTFHVHLDIIKFNEKLGEQEKRKDREETKRRRGPCPPLIPHTCGSDVCQVWLRERGSKGEGREPAIGICVSVCVTQQR